LLIAPGGVHCGEAMMKIYKDAMDQCLLCAGYDFHDDTPLRREMHQRAFGPALRHKEWWRYQHGYLGLTTFVAYEGVEPVGHIELIPIEHALRPVDGRDLIIIHCMHVPQKAQGRGIGKALLEMAMMHASGAKRGLAAIGQSSGSFMPSSFFKHYGFSIVDQREEEVLLTKRWKGAGPAAFLPVRFEPRTVPDEVTIDYLHCPQCPKSGWALSRMRKSASRLNVPIKFDVHEVAERAAVERTGYSHAIFVNGELVGGMPPDPLQLNAALQVAAEAHHEHML